MLYASGHAIFITYVIMAVVATVGVVLRAWSKKRSRQQLGLADYLSLAALVLFYGYTIEFLYGLVQSGGTLAIPEMTSLEQIIDVMKWVWISELFMTIILTLVKLSVVAWYWSIFGLVDDFRRPMIITAALCIAWGLAFLFVVIFQCIPVHAAWDLVAATTAKCIPFGNILLPYEVTNMVLDVVILALPVRIIWGLRMSTTRKILVACIFGLGGFVSITCIIRVHYMYKPNDTIHVDIYNGMLWASIEMGVAILCSCLPTLGPLVSGNIISGTLSRWYHSLRSRSTTKKPSASYSSRNLPPMLPYQPEKGDSTHWLHGSRGSGDQDGGKPGITLDPV
ncbi:hypothetical protein QBC43DRAFT_323820 [Cladorrhinum sp. PSN259]|nr:hypothetical protein QBC43DRAFT_323820 [Cladorrhinum sp. PSN259]